MTAQIGYLQSTLAVEVGQILCILWINEAL